MQTVAVEEKIPVGFVRKFLATRGHKEFYEVWCECTTIDFGGLWPSHPIRWLWKHVQEGHEPSFTCCHCWNRQVGRETGEIEEWYRWFTFTWSKKHQDWLVSDTYQGCEGFETPSPAEWWRRAKRNSAENIITLPSYQDYQHSERERF